MKKLAIVLITALLIPVFAFTQTTEEFDLITPYNEGVAAVKKNNQWGFINAFIVLLLLISG